jgi:hypothetical protein
MSTLPGHVNDDLLTAAQKFVHHIVNVEVIQDPPSRTILQEHVDLPAPSSEAVPRMKGILHPEPRSIFLSNDGGCAKKTMPLTRPTLR